MSAIDLRLGRWQDVLADVECDALIMDPPYSERTHAATAEHHSPDGGKRMRLGYEPIDEAEVYRIVDSWALRNRGWWCVFSDHIQQPWWELALFGAGLYVFAPLPIVDVGSGVRLAGDGPSSWTTWLTVARPKALSKWGTLPGYYTRSPGDDRSPRRGGKPLGVMQAIVRDYTRPGDLVCDPFAGAATTLIAAASQGRRAVGSEVDPGTHAQAITRIASGFTLDMFAATQENR